MSSSTNDSTGTIRFCEDVGNILATKHIAHIPKVDCRCSVFMILGHVIERKLFVMRKSKHFGGIQETCVVDRSIMVESLDHNLVLVCDSSIADIYKTICRS